MTTTEGRTAGAEARTPGASNAHTTPAQNIAAARRPGRSGHRIMRRAADMSLLDGDAAAGLVTAEGALVIELGAPRRLLLHDHDLLERGGAEREELLDANAVGLAPDGEGARNVLLAVVDREDLALEILKTGLVAFLDADGHTDGVAGVDFRELLRGELRGLLGVDLLDELDSHDCTYSFFAKSSSPAANVPPASRRSGRRRDVRSTAWRFRQAAAFAWSPPARTAGT